MSDAAPLGSIASAIVGAMQKWERKPADFYPTPPDVTYSLRPHILDLLPEGSRVLEPACGDGAMAMALEECGYEVDGYDLREDSGYGVGNTDYLGSDFTSCAYDAVITNPPFKIADKFIELSLNQAPVVAMLLKSQYWHAAKRRSLFEKHRPCRVLPLTWRPSFLEKERGSSPLMDVMWVIWSAGSNSTDYYPIRRITAPPYPRVASTAPDDFEAMFT
jgi:hypothetical protein